MEMFPSQRSLTFAHSTSGAPMQRLPVALLMVGCLSFQAGCARWEVSGASTAPSVIASHGWDARVQKIDGSVITLDSAIYRKDTVFGTSSKGERIGIPAAEIRQVAIKSFDGGKTAGAIFLGILGTLVLIIASFAQTNASSY
jgi:hypothetical protein